MGDSTSIISHLRGKELSGSVGSNVQGLLYSSLPTPTMDPMKKKVSCKWGDQ